MTIPVKLDPCLVDGRAGRLRPAEWVFPGHPDRLADAVAGALAREARARDDFALCGVEVAVHRDVVFVDGRLAGRDAASIDVDAIVRDAYRAAGYGGEFPPDPERLRVLTDLDVGPLLDGEDAIRPISDDQAIVVGYWNALPGCDGQPVEQATVLALGPALAALRVEEPGLGLGPDGKVLVVVAEHADGRFALQQVSVSLQHVAGHDAVALERAVRRCIAKVVAGLADRIPGYSPAVPDTIVVNGAGDFVCGGPHGDNGLSGKKLVVDFHGPRVPIGGGAIFGKDDWKPDHRGPVEARRLARLACERDGARECTVTMIVRPGDREFQVLGIEKGAAARGAQASTLRSPTSRGTGARRLRGGA